jgi:hypothetical protein
MVQGCGVAGDRQWLGVPGNRKNRRNRKSRRRRPRVVPEAPRAGEEDRTRLVRKWLAVAVQRAAASRPGRSGAQRAGGPSQALPHRVCATHGWSVRREERRRSRPRATWPAGRRRAHGADSTYSLQGPVTSPGRPPTAGERPLWTKTLSSVHSAAQTIRETISAWRQRPRVSDTAADTNSSRMHAKWRGLLRGAHSGPVRAGEGAGSACRRSRGSTADLKPCQTSITASHWAQTSGAYFGVYHGEPGCSEDFQDAASMAKVSLPHRVRGPGVVEEPGAAFAACTRRTGRSSTGGMPVEDRAAGG